MSEEQMDTDGGQDRAERRHELKQVWKRCAKRYCRICVKHGPGGADGMRAHSAMTSAYIDWQDAH